MSTAERESGCGMKLVSLLYAFTEQNIFLHGNYINLLSEKIMIYFMGMFIPNIFLGVFLEELCVLEVIIGKNNFPLKRAHFFFFF